MMSQDLHGFSSDKPIQNSADDLLGRSGFSEDLARAIERWRGEESLVVALHGEWGSGKSSIKNMAVAKLQGLSVNPPNVVQFSPWEWAAQERITATLFQEISKSIGRKDRSKSGKKLAKTLRVYGRYLNTGESIATSLTTALPTLFVIAAMTGIGASLVENIWVRYLSTSILVVLLGTTAVLKWGSKVMNTIGRNIDANSNEHEQSLSDIREDLKSLLTSRTSSLVIVMDDLDRLTSDQLRMVFQLVKANLELPNVVFLLLYQRDLVEEKMTEGNHSGREYLEKIVQVPFDIPRLNKHALQKLLFSRLDQILEKDSAASEMFDTTRWGNLFHGALHIYFENLRDVYRYTSTLSFHFSLHRGESAFEVNPVDLIAIECVRVFEPELYNYIASSRSIFTNSGFNAYTANREDTASFINGILENVSENKKSKLKYLIAQLFPHIGRSLGGTSYSDNPLRDMRICHPSVFDKYFQLSIPSENLSNSDLRKMLSYTSNTDDLVEFILLLQDRGILNNALTQFMSFIDEIKMGDGLQYLTALLNVADEIDNKSDDPLTPSSQLHSARLATFFLRRIEAKEERGKLLLECFKASNGLFLTDYILYIDEKHRSKNLDPDVLLRDEDFETLKTEFISRLESNARDNPELLLRHKNLISLLYSWERWGDVRNAREWLNSQINSTHNCIILLNHYMGKSSSQTIGDYVTSVSTSINIDNIENFIAVDLLVELTCDIDISALDSEEVNTVTLFREALHNRNLASGETALPSNT